MQLTIPSRAASAVVLVSANMWLTGCGTTLLSDRESNPVLQDFVVRWWGRASTLSTTASRRLALMSYKHDKDGNEALVTCAEPPPDVGETFAKAFAAQLELKAAKGIAGGDTSLGGGVQTNLATAIAPLMARTQGLQILRDSAYTLCVDYMNGWIKDDAEYMRVKQDRFDKAIELIKLELSHMPERAAPLAAPTPPPPAANTRTSSAETPAAAAAR